MPVFINLDYTGWFAEFARRHGGKGISQKGKRILLTTSNRKCVSWWHTRIVPKTFKLGAGPARQFKERKKPYRVIKQRMASGQAVFVNGQRIKPERVIKQGRVDLVRSGKAEAKAKIITAIRATPAMGVARVTVPHYVRRRRSAEFPDMRKEIASTTKSDVDQLTRVWRKTFLAGVRTFGKSIRLKRVVKSKGTI